MTMTNDPATGVLVRPQPVGVFPLPAGYLVIPDGHDDVRASLVEGKLPAEWPDELRFYAIALDGDPVAAAAALTGDDLVARANRLVLEPSRTSYEALAADAAAAGDAAFVVHVDTIAFALGLRPAPPDPSDTDGEFSAMAAAAHATAALERGDTAAAIEHLEAAAQSAHDTSVPLAGQLMGQLANTQLDEGGVQRASVTFQAALDAMAGTDLHLTSAELHVAAGAMYQEMSEAAPRLMQQAINHYHQALALVRRDDAPETWAIANANLGLAYLMMPMQEASDLLRTGVAVQSMRDALTHFTPETHPDRWSSTQLNLANALVYMPSKHQADNIAEAVELYEAVLEHRSRGSDPQGRARVLANQGNALAHLGMFDQAKARLHEARAIFEEFGEDEAVRSVRGVLDEIAKQESLVRQDRP
ncbi:MAG: tetratricopeptide repeat protein [Ilumatobacter sp.]|nr:tetratricopeptide repeat protein [Ilumatobacter sp.]MDJ0771346.1 tetratricopeptide repeat protein [Ilumatobacter sp.]